MLFIKEIKLFDIGDMLKNRVVRQQTDYVNSNKHYYKKFCRLNTVYAMAQDSVSLLLKIAIIMQAVTQKLTIGAASMYISSVDSFNASFQGMLSQISTLYEQTRYLSYISDVGQQFSVGAGGCKVHSKVGLALARIALQHTELSKG